MPPKNNNPILYDSIAAEWDRTRRNPWSEFEFARELLTACQILDAGCGNGRFVGWLRTQNFRGEYRGVDVSKKLLAHARQNFPHEKFEFADLLNFRESEKFTAVVCIAVLHHFPTAADRLKILQNLHASLRPGGRIFLTMWNLWQLKYWKYFFKNFSRNLEIPFGTEKIPRQIFAFRKNELVRLLRRTGFHDIEVFYARGSSRSNFWNGKNLIALARK